MADLTANLKRTFEVNLDPLLNDVPVKAGAHIFEGAAVGDDAAGYGRLLAAADPFRGFAVAEIDNTDGDDGDANVRVRERGRVVLAVATVAGPGDVGETVYASDSNTFTLVAGGNTAIGKVARHESGTRCVVDFEAQQHRSV